MSSQHRDNTFGIPGLLGSQLGPRRSTFAGKSLIFLLFTEAPWLHSAARLQLRFRISMLSLTFVKQSGK